MKWYWDFNRVLMLFVYCIFLHSDSHGYVTALESDTGGNGNDDPLSIPLINDNGAPLVAMLDTNAINRRMKSYITTITKNMIQNTLKGQIHGIIRTSLEENSTIDLIRNITLQEVNGALKDQVQDSRVKKRDPEYKDCSDVKQNSDTQLTNGVYTIYPDGNNPIQAYCDMTTDGGGWTIIHNRYGGTLNFQRKWKECENGFGDINAEFWFGNKYTHILTSSGKYELRVDMVDTSGQKFYANYGTFHIGDTWSKYKLSVSSYSGNAGNALKSHNGMKFTTVDQDNDIYSIKNCAIAGGGSWWYYTCIACDLTRSGKHKPEWLAVSPVVKSVMMIRQT